MIAAVEPLVAAVDLTAIVDEADFLAPVPMRGRRRVLGFNQAERITRVLAARLGQMVEIGVLHQTRASGTQARQADLADRRANVAGAFAVPTELVRRPRVLLVDDVTTSGATLGAYARVLLDAGAESVEALALARQCLYR